MQKIELTSPAFNDSDFIPAKYTCEGSDVSVPLKWSTVPEGAKSLVVICDDPDAPRGTWVHWVLFNIPPDITELPEGVSIKNEPKLSGAIEGVNDNRKTKYSGPCPPPGSAHRYFFKIYALDTTLALDSKATKANVEKSMARHILGTGQLLGKYKR